MFRVLDGGMAMIPKDVLLTNQTQTVLSSNGTGWKWLDQEGSTSRSATCNLFLRDLLLSGSKILSWTWDKKSCFNTLRRKMFHVQPVPNAVFPLASTAAATSYNYSSETSWQTVELLLLKKYNHSFDSPFTVDDVPPTADYYFPDQYTNYLDYQYDSDYYYDTHCDEPFDVDDAECTLTLSPSSLEGNDTSQRLPHGIPTLVCSHLPSYTEGAAFTLRYKVAASYKDSNRRWNENTSLTVPPLGLLPHVACNMATSSPRFGGRCAAPVVQYLAYDEAYYTDAARTSGLPEYGGCLAGGLMRHLASQAAVNSTHWDNATIRNWFTPPMWPFEVWRSAPDSPTSAASSFYTNDPGRQQSLNTDQEKLNRLYFWQDVYKLSSIQGSAGEGGAVCRPFLSLVHPRHTTYKSHHTATTYSKQEP
jgi:hypothetical protein